MNDKQDKPITFDTVYNSAIAYLARRDHATDELRKKLARKEYPSGLIEDVIEHLHELSYLDDQRFASTQSRILVRKRWGPQAIAQKLRQRGISDHIIDAAMQEIAQETDWDEVCAARLQQHLGKKSPESLSQKEKQRAYRHLYARGFSPNSIRRVLFR